MEYAPLTWMSSARCHLNLLLLLHGHSAEERAERLISGVHRKYPHQQPLQQRHHHHQQEQQQPVLRDTLEHRRRVAALTVLYIKHQSCSYLTWHT